MLTRLGFLVSHVNPAMIEYTLAEDAERFLDGLGFNYHTMTLDGQETFGIP